LFSRSYLLSLGLSGKLKDTDMIYKTLISVEELSNYLNASSPQPLLVLDCSFDLTNPAAGEQAFALTHIAGSHYVHLDRDLSSAKTGFNGRHPLPTRDDFVATMSRLGLKPETQVVAYDNAGGMYAARLWWMLRWLGHESAAVLDGGFTAWKAADKPATDDRTATSVPSNFVAGNSLVRVVNYSELRSQINQTEALLVLDARAPDRFRGENETLDPVAGHIPHARNHLFKNNIGADGCFKPATELKAMFEPILAGRSPSELVNQCGSGVTACHNLLALEVAGLAGSTLYPGSWSEWCAQSDTLIATGAAF
jgi:thiosulfate/3-mercaptopyruvate sulfurtransferase